MSMAGPNNPDANSRVVADVVCTSCGCLCDDIELTLEGDRVTEARNACPMGRDTFLGYRVEDGPACLIDGEPATFEAGIERAARILSGARHPLIFGLGETTTEAQRAAVGLAVRAGACIDVSSGESGRAAMEALQSVGEVTCTLGEIRNRADLVIVWRADPLETHPRLFSRYALEPAGAFIPRGRADRYCAVVDTCETTSVREAADEFLCIKDGAEVEALWTLRALAKGIPLDAEAVEAETGVSLLVWQALWDRMTSARYGVLFYGVGGSRTGSDPLLAHGIHSLTRDLNAFARFVCMPLSTGGANDVGARNVLGWRTGYPGALSLAQGDPRYGPGEFGASDLLRRNEVDAALVVAGDPTSALDATIPTIVLGPDVRRIAGGSTVVFRTALLGINTAGTVYRMDGVPLPLRTLLRSPFPDDETVLRAIERRVRALHAEGHRAEGRV